MVASNVDVETLVGRPMAFVSEMPFAGEESLVAVFFEYFGNGDFLKGQMAAVVRVEQGVCGSIGLTGYPVGDIDAYRMSSGHNTGACRAANRSGGIALREAHAAFGQAINVRCIVECAAVAPDVCPAHVVHKKE